MTAMPPHDRTRTVRPPVDRSRPARTGAAAPGPDRYAGDVLAARRRPVPVEEVPATPGLVVEEVTTGWCGAVLRVEKVGGMHVVVLEDRRLRTRTFPLGPDFLLEGRPVTLVRPRPAAAGPVAPARSASGSVAVAGARARVARASRILVEGTHDAELVERVWGHDLRVEGVVVEALDGVDDLAVALRDFRPGPGRRIGVLVDHLVAGSKEWREAEAVSRSPALREHVLVVGHPYVDVWQAVRPQRVGLDAWPVVPRGRPWKEGVLAHLGWAHDTPQDVGRGWGRILGTVRSWTDLEPELLGRVEELIDFVTGDDGDR
ncbi:DUF3097 family protein [Aquipuribacter sp. MA13-6]|uniref:DUF3097 family protein n=1 Tax=unclassified Aquipuribacter TaxID=2635084 RepID=UPI003EE9232F